MTRRLLSRATDLLATALLGGWWSPAIGVALLVAIGWWTSVWAVLGIVAVGVGVVAWVVRPERWRIG